MQTLFNSPKSNVTPQQFPPSYPQFGLPTSVGGGLADLLSGLGSFSGFRDWIRLFLIGGLVETGRRSLWSLWAYLIQYLYIEAYIEAHEPAYQWLLIWLAEQQAWGNARSVLVTTSSSQSNPGDNRPRLRARRRRQKDDVKNYEEEIQLQPGYGKSCHIWYKRSLVQVCHNRGGANSLLAMQGLPVEGKSIAIRIYGGTHAKLQAFLLEARTVYKKTVQNRITIWSSNDSRNMGYSGFTTSTVRPKRSLESVVLGEDIKQMLLEDTQEFLSSETWYAERGIPWRRGYLLHGCPGSGKTSLIHALAGELDLDIYVISLSKRNMDDGDLQSLISMLPARSIALMEDIDVAFTRASAEPEAPKTPLMSPYNNMRGMAGMDVGSSSSGITLAGLLAAIDGVAAQEGRILFATTNRYSALDPALRRPGRLDIHVEFHPANRAQAEKLFTRFYPADSHVPTTSSVASEIDRPFKAPLVDISDEKNEEQQASEVVSVSEGTKATILSTEQLASLAKEFAGLVPEGELSMAAIQGHLMRYKTRPYEAVAQTHKWVDQERKQRRDGETPAGLTDNLGVAIAGSMPSS